MKLYSWGANTNGQLGQNYASEQISRPTKIINEIINSELNESIPNKKSNPPRILIHGGGTQVLISILGNNSLSTLLHLGVKSSLLKESPTPRELFFPQIITKNVQINAISCGWEFNLVLAGDNQVYSFGDNKYGQLGRGTCPKEFLPIPDFRAVKISAGLRHSAAISTNGSLYFWGDNSKFKWAGNDKIDKIIEDPLRISENEFVGVKCGKSFLLALDDQNSFWGCGQNKFGELGPGLGTFVKGLTKLRIKLPSRVVQFECGWTHTIVLLEDFRVVSWGRNNFSQLGRTTLKDFDECWGFVGGIHEPIGSICCGSEHNLVLNQSGSNVYAWGWNEHENCGVKSSRVSFCENFGTKLKLCEDCVLTPTIVGVPEDRTLYVACGNGNGFAVCE